MTFDCFICNKQYSNKGSLCNHNRKFHNNKQKKTTHECKFCNKEYSLYKSKWKHEKKCSILSLNNVIPEPIQEELTKMKKEILELKLLFTNHKRPSEPVYCGTCNNELPKKKNPYIPSPIKRLVWDKYIGESIGKEKCLCCKLTDITQMSFHCGHVISQHNGGSIEVENLRPICQNCNSSMKSTNMDEFMNNYKLNENNIA